MIAAIVNSRTRERVLFAILVLTGTMGGVLAFPPSYLSNTNVLIGLCLFPLTLFATGARRNNYLYLIVMVAFATLADIYEVRVFYFFSLAFYFIWLYELFVGRLNELILFLIVFMSPAFHQVVTILGFPIRLMLSDLAGSILNLSGVNVQVRGNMVMLDGAVFSVDEACMGLNMLAIALLMGVFLVAFHHGMSKRSLSFFSLSIFFVFALVLNMVANVIRIVALVYFKIGPEHIMHEGIGIICLVVYVLLPLQFISKWIVRRYGRKGNDDAPAFLSTHHTYTAVAMCLLVLWVGSSIESDRYARGIPHARVNFADGKHELLNDGITKISTDDMLIYVKVIPEFFTGEHTPLMCWKGSGYEFAGVTTGNVEGVTIYKGTLVHEGIKLHTAWWYSNGEIQTISQMDWRIRMLRGEPGFSLVNVTSADEQKLLKTVSTMLTTRPLIATD